jgi:putative endonuclease
MVAARAANVVLMFYVSVLKSLVDKRLYKGLTKDLNKRVKEHNSGWTRSTKAYRPWKLVYFERFQTLHEAREREKYLKSGIGREFLKNILDS